MTDPSDDADADPTIADIDASKGATKELGKIDLISAEEVIKAVDELKKAAVDARAEELLAEETESGNASGSGVSSTSSGRESQATEELAEYDLDEKFKFFYERRPYDASSMALHFTMSKKALSSGEMSAVVEVKDSVNGWAGDARDAFKKHFLNPLILNGIYNQQALCDELTVASNAYEGILRAGRLDAKEIAEKCTVVLDAIAAGEKDAEQTEFALRVAEVGIGIASAATGGPVGLTFGLLTNGISLIKGATARTDGEFTEPTTKAVMDKLVKELDNLKTAMDEEEASIAEGLKETQTEVESVLASDSASTKSTLLPNEPTGGGAAHKITSGSKPPENEFHPPRD